MLKPVVEVDATPIYSDAKGSITNEANAKKSASQLKGITSFYVSLEKVLDDASSADELECAYRDFQAWAAAGALTETASNEGAIQRLQYFIGLEIIALKFKDKGLPLTKRILDWLAGINLQIMQNYEVNKSSKIRSNLYYWSGAGAALFALISEKDGSSLRYQDVVWRDILNDINSDGTLDREMGRGQRALIYHLYAFSAMLVLREARRALAITESSSEERSLRRLSDAIGKALCHPEIMARRAKVEKLEIPGDWAYRLNTVFGDDLLSADWHSCGLFPVRPTDVRLGGSATYSLQAIRAASRLPSIRSGK